MINYRDEVLKQQNDNWPHAVEAGRKGNPFATLCMHCYGRHRPPRDDICPYQPPNPTPPSTGRDDG